MWGEWRMTNGNYVRGPIWRAKRMMRSFLEALKPPGPEEPCVWGRVRNQRVTVEMLTCRPYLASSSTTCLTDQKAWPVSSQS